MSVAPRSEAWVEVRGERVGTVVKAKQPAAGGGARIGGERPARLEAGDEAWGVGLCDPAEAAEHRADRRRAPRARG
jgi:hypothetical protein